MYKKCGFIIIIVVSSKVQDNGYQHHGYDYDYCDYDYGYDYENNNDKVIKQLIVITMIL